MCALAQHHPLVAVGPTRPTPIRARSRMMTTNRMTVRTAYHRMTRYTVRLMRFVPLLAVIVTGLAAYLSRGVLDQVPSSSGLMRVALLPPWQALIGFVAMAATGLLWLDRRAARAGERSRAVSSPSHGCDVAGAGARGLDPAVSAAGRRRLPAIPDPRRPGARHRLDCGRRADRVGLVAIGNGGRALGCER